MSQISKNVASCFAYLSLIIELSKGRKISGYDILKHVRSFGLEVGSGTVYHQLKMLEKAGLVKGTRVKRVNVSKTVYEMTDKGVQAYEEFREIWRRAVQYISQNLE